MTRPYQIFLLSVFLFSGLTTLSPNPRPLENAAKDAEAAQSGFRGTKSENPFRESSKYAKETSGSSYHQQGSSGFQKDPNKHPKSPPKDSQTPKPERTEEEEDAEEQEKIKEEQIRRMIEESLGKNQDAQGPGVIRPTSEPIYDEIEPLRKMQEQAAKIKWEKEHARGVIPKLYAEKYDWYVVKGWKIVWRGFKKVLGKFFGVIGKILGAPFHQVIKPPEEEFHEITEVPERK